MAAVFLAQPIQKRVNWKSGPPHQYVKGNAYDHPETSIPVLHCSYCLGAKLNILLGALHG